ncbi:MAG: stalk domain-containing protein [Syntrophomonas sp.]
MRSKKFFIGMLVLLGMISILQYARPVSAERVIRIFMDGKEILSPDQAPLIVNDRTMVPLRVIGEGLGLKVDWDQPGFRVLISSPGWEGQAPAAVSVNSKVPGIFIDGKELKPKDANPIIKNDRVLLPVRDISEAIGREVKWDADNYMVLVMSAPSSPVVAQPNEPAVVQPGDAVDVQPIDTPTQQETPIIGESIATSEQLRNLLRINNPLAPDLVDLYLEIGKIYGIRGDIAFCQAAKETGWWKFGGLALPEQNNYCGLSVTGKAATAEEDLRGANPQKVHFEEGKHGAFFDTPASGVEAHIQHLYAYATASPLPEGRDLLDPRFSLVRRGIAPNWIDLGGKWAVPGYDRNKYGSIEEALGAGDSYGHSILKDYYGRAVGETTQLQQTVRL